jgi:hypothetical protein
VTRRTQPALFGPAVTTWPRGARKTQLTLPGLDPLAERQLEADSIREFLERMRAAALPELEEPPDLED